MRTYASITTANSCEAAVKHQFAGDIHDYRKYALLRRLQAESGLRIGVCWMLTPDDGRSDGNKTTYLHQPRHERHDPDLYRLLAGIMDGPDRRGLELIEVSGIIPGAVYHNVITPDALADRVTWFSHALAKLTATDLIFFDPDNGLDVPSRRKGRKDSSKYLFRDELAATWAVGHSALLYQHFPYEERDPFIARIAVDVRTATPGSDLWVFRTAHVAFFLAIQPRHHTALHPAAQAVSGFDQSFLTATHIQTPT